MSTEQPTQRYLKNAWVKKDGEGDYWLYIQSGPEHAMFCFTEGLDINSDECAGIRRSLEAWLADQDRPNGNSEN